MNSVGLTTPGIQQALAQTMSEHAQSLRSDVAEDVAAVITVEEDLRFFTKTFESVLHQRVLPSCIVIADCSGETSTPLYSSFEVLEPNKQSGESFPRVHTVQVQLVRAKGASSFSHAVSQALSYARLPESVRGLWLLHDDSRPENPHCLDALREAWRNAPKASLIGAKQIDWDEPNLHNVGYYAAKHRLVSLVVDGEPDQEQYDARQDVFAVSLAGALMPLSTFNRFGGMDSWFGTFGESAEISRRICLHAGRVIVVPQAVIAHRRARYEGIRTKNGLATEPHTVHNPYLSVAAARLRYRITDSRMTLWPLLWVWLVLQGIGSFAQRLFRKQPYEAICDLCIPWRLFLIIPGAIAARRRLVHGKTVALSSLNMLVAGRSQLKQWRERNEAFAEQGSVTLLSPLALAHLHRQMRIRLLWMVALLIVTCTAAAASQHVLITGLFQGEGAASGTLLPFDASWSQLWNTATSNWSFGSGLGIFASPTPFAFIIVVANVITFGHANIALLLMIVLAAPLCAISFWALAGTFTRSNIIRFATSLLWAASTWLLGIYSDGSVAMAVTMVFLPASFAFMLRAVGMYRTEMPALPHPSIQSAALASLCFMPVTLSEPQIVLPLIAVFAAFLVMVRSHRTMLLLIPIPSALALAPVLLNAVEFWAAGDWRQLFGDVQIPVASVGSSPKALNALQLIAQSFDMQFMQGQQWWLLQGDVLVIALWASFALLTVFGICALALPFALRLSRMMWILAIAGLLLALVSVRVGIGTDAGTGVAASPSPGLALVILALLSCVCLIAGSAVHQFIELAQRSSIKEISAGSRRRFVSVAKAGRISLALVLFACIAVWGVYGGLLSNSRSSLAPSGSGLPMVARDYLSQKPSHRVLALAALSSNRVDYSLMRTGNGDIIDSSPAARVSQYLGRESTASAAIGQACAELLSNSADDAIASLTNLGIGAIYVPYTGMVNNLSATNASVSSESATDSLISNITASAGVQPVVSNGNGTYFRLIGLDAYKGGISTVGEREALNNPFRMLWLWCLAICLVVYCLVALPRRTRSSQR
ncbi:glycosyltransferase family 2 protein [Bifidobacterium aquikefiricola]|uniref:Glycosyltransferase family 2 protein n=1 Tax=Bifidobacterium aquikefiricola TaxID=3059038 RepID=A0AB39U3Z8_9BIFI